MAEGQVKHILEKEVTCPLCLDLFKDPKKLPCDHVYCKDCLRGLALRSLNETISCPECRTLTQVPGNDVNNFPTAFRINRLIEAFKQVQIRVETDSPSATEMCQVHLTQPLAIYCETCKKQLCRDCVLMSKEHASHEYGFFAEVAPKYRKQLASEMSLITTQDSSVSSTLEKIAVAESSVADHTRKCQDDVEHTFEELISILQTYKQAMKDEATTYFSSLTGVFDQQKEKLRDIQSKIKSVITSVDTTLQDDDKSFLMRMESTFERISHLQKKFQAISLTVAKPQLIAMRAVDADSVAQCMKTKYSFYNLADANMCLVDGSLFTDARVYIGQQMLFTLTLCDSGGNDSIGENEVDICLLPLPQGILIKGKLEPLPHGRVKVTLTPEKRGQHQLSVKINGAHIKDSPFIMTVYVSPNHLSRPVATIPGLERPTGLRRVQDTVLVVEMNKSRIIEIDSHLHFKEFKQLSGAGELTQDSNLNIYVTTSTTHQLVKLSSTGSTIKIVGKLGKRNAEFNLPNGLRVSKNRELYVCDSGNNRVQVFDLDLNFKRSFGKKGSGKGLFNFPADVTFDSHGNIYITDIENHRIQVFTCTEYHIRSINHPGVHTFRPVSLLMHDESLYVTDDLNHKVWVMSTSGEVIATFGDGILRSPEGITMDKDGFVYVTSSYSKIVVF